MGAPDDHEAQARTRVRRGRPRPDGGGPRLARPARRGVPDVPARGTGGSLAIRGDARQAQAPLRAAGLRRRLPPRHARASRPRPAIGLCRCLGGASRCSVDAKLSTLQAPTAPSSRRRTATCATRQIPAADLRDAFDDAGFGWATSHVLRKTSASVLDAGGSLRGRSPTSSATPDGRSPWTTTWVRGIASDNAATVMEAALC